MCVSASVPAYAAISPFPRNGKLIWALSGIAKIPSPTVAVRGEKYGVPGCMGCFSDRCKHYVAPGCAFHDCGVMSLVLL